MFGAFLVPMFDFASNDTRIPAVSAWTEDLPAYFLGQPLVPLGERARGCLVQMALQNAERIHEG